MKYLYICNIRDLQKGWIFDFYSILLPQNNDFASNKGYIQISKCVQGFIQLISQFSGLTIEKIESMPIFFVDCQDYV